MIEREFIEEDSTKTGCCRCMVRFNVLYGKEKVELLPLLVPQMSWNVLAA
jgi:hypothetical protein